MTKVRVDPATFEAASVVFGNDLARLVRGAATTLESALGHATRMAGRDSGGVEWAANYDGVAGETVQAIDDLERAGVTVAALLQQTGFNHARADAHSDMSGASEIAPDTTTYQAGGAACVAVPSAAGGSFPAPDGWEKVAAFCSAVWPDGDPGRLRAAATAWRAEATTLHGGTGLVADAIATVQDQDSPEMGTALTICASFRGHLADIAEQCTKIAASCDDQADAVEKAHSDLEEQITEFIASTVVIEAAGAAVGAFTFGVGPGVSEGVEAGNLAVVIARILRTIDELVEAARVAASRVVEGALESVIRALGKILAKSPEVAKTTAARSARIADAIARAEMGGLVAKSTATPEQLLRYLKGASPKGYDEFLRTGKWPKGEGIPARSEYLDENGRIKWNEFAPNDGYRVDGEGKPIRTETVPLIGDRFDRSGPDGGRYVAVQENGKAASYTSRSMPFVKGSQEYHEYLVTGDLTPSGLTNAARMLQTGSEKTRILEALSDGVKAYRGEAAPGFRGKGGALQIEMPQSIRDLNLLKLIKEV